jgi:hypothetical protein
MKSRQIERWALEVIERAEAHQPIEDSKVELKAEWPADPARAARRIAGHANAARGEHILWLIGIDEDKGVIGANYAEMSDWLAGISKQFNELTPRCYDLNVPTKDGKTVVALVFETDRAPYVVKNPAFGNTTGEGVKFEVPWREGTIIRSATRSDLMLLFTDVALLRSLYGELEWNAAVAGESAPRQSRFRTKKFFLALDQGVLPPELKELLLEAYMAVDNAQSCKKTLEHCTNVNERFHPESTETMARGLAKDKIEKALTQMRQYLNQ